MKRLVGPLLIAVLVVVVWRLLAGGNPGGISDGKYAQYKALRPPKLLYSCTRQPTQEWLNQRKRDCAHTGRAGCEEEVNESREAQPQAIVDFAGSDGSATYDELLNHVRRECSSPRGHLAPGKLAVLESEKG
jgi:hypothetical protein